MFPEADVSVTKCHLLFLLLLALLLRVCSFRLLTCGAVHFSELLPKRTAHLDSYVWPEPSTASALHPQVFYSVRFHSPSFASLRPKPHSWPNMAWSHQSDAWEYLSETLSDTTAMEAERKEKKTKKPTLLSGLLEQHWGDTERWEKPDIAKDLRGKEFLFLVWSEATGTGLHSQVPEQNQRNLSGLNRTQNRRSQTSVSVCRGVWIPVKPHVCFLQMNALKWSKDYNICTEIKWSYLVIQTLDRMHNLSHVETKNLGLYQ